MMYNRLGSALLALLMFFSACTANAAHEHGHSIPIFKIMGGGLVVAGIMKMANRCKYGVVDSTITDQLQASTNRVKFALLYRSLKTAVIMTQMN